MVILILLIFLNIMILIFIIMVFIVIIIIGYDRKSDIRTGVFPGRRSSNSNGTYNKAEVLIPIMNVF